MININIGKLLVYTGKEAREMSGENVCNIIEFDADFRTPELLNDDNYVAYSGSTRDTIMSDPIMYKLFQGRFDERLFQISEIIDTIESAMMPDNPELLEWMKIWCRKALELYGEDAYIMT